mmetsp:Transcript_44414/g.101821  ORF Transcript_44414/g.101821 Transcript_44414/m.101821 type:complete len:765 (-) Transcript_44414:36-2330(-)
MSSSKKQRRWRPRKPGSVGRTRSVYCAPPCANYAPHVNSTQNALASCGEQPRVGITEKPSPVFSMTRRPPWSVPHRELRTSSRLRSKHALSQPTSPPSHVTAQPQSVAARRRARRTRLAALHNSSVGELNSARAALVRAAAKAAETCRQQALLQPGPRAAKLVARAEAAAAAAASAAHKISVATRAAAAQAVGHRLSAAPFHACAQESRAVLGAYSGPLLHRRLRERSQAWEQAGASKRVLAWLREGVQISWNERRAPPPFHHGVSTFTAAERAWLSLEKQRCLASGAWAPATQLTHVSRAFVTYHNGKPRLVIDLRFINAHTRKRTCSAVAGCAGVAGIRLRPPAARLPPARGGGRPATAPQLAGRGLPGVYPPRHELHLQPADGTAFEHLRPELGQWRGGETAIRLAATALETSTARAYNRHWLAFCQWCAAHGLCPMPATPRMVFAYIGFLAEKGTVAADSLQPYLSAINAAHADYGHDRPALGHLIARARQGMRRAQALAATRDTRVPLPAAAVLRVLRHACASASAWQRDLSATACAHLLRGAYAVCLSFLFFGRQDSCVALRILDHGIQHDAIWLRLTEKMRKAAALRRIVRIPLSAPPVKGHASFLPEVAALGRMYLSAAHRLERTCTTREQRAYLFQLPGEPPPRTADMSSWLHTQLRMVDVRAPPGFSYLGHSIRSGASSAAEAIGVSRFLGNWMGGWSQTGRTRELHYMDPSVRPCPAAFGFFGWMLDGRFEALPPTWEYRVGARPNDEPGEPA